MGDWDKYLEKISMPSFLKPSALLQGGEKIEQVAREPLLGLAEKALGAGAGVRTARLPSARPVGRLEHLLDVAVNPKTGYDPPIAKWRLRRQDLARNALLAKKAGLEQILADAPRYAHLVDDVAILGMRAAGMKHEKQPALTPKTAPPINKEAAVPWGHLARTAALPVAGAAIGGATGAVSAEEGKRLQRGLLGAAAGAGLGTVAAVGAAPFGEAAGRLYHGLRYRKPILRERYLDREIEDLERKMTAQIAETVIDPKDWSASVDRLRSLTEESVAAKNAVPLGSRANTAALGELGGMGAGLVGGAMAAGHAAGTVGSSMPKSKQASLDQSLGVLYTEYGPCLQKHAAARFYSSLDKSRLDQEALGAPFCKLAAASGIDPWTMAIQVVKGYPNLVKMAAGRPSQAQELAAFYVAWGDEVEKRANILTTGIGNLASKAKAVGGALFGQKGALRSAKHLATQGVVKAEAPGAGQAVSRALNKQQLLQNQGGGSIARGQQLRTDRVAARTTREAARPPAAPAQRAAPAQQASAQAAPQPAGNYDANVKAQFQQEMGLPATGAKPAAAPARAAAPAQPAAQPAAPTQPAAQPPAAPVEGAAAAPTNWEALKGVGVGAGLGGMGMMGYNAMTDAQPQYGGGYQ